jgi:hypothetical protein
MIEKDDLASHWNDLAEQLGLDPEPASQAKPERASDGPKVAPERMDREEIVEKARAPFAEKHICKDEIAPPPPDIVFARPEEAASFPSAKEEISAFAPEPATPDEIVVDEAPPARQRGRRSPKGDRDNRRNTPESGPRGKPESDEAGGERPGRRGGRGKKRQDPPSGPDKRREQSDEPVAVAPTRKEVAQSLDDDKEEDYSTWTVPLWQDLISSLYRPER